MFRTFIRQYWDWLLLILLGVPALWPYTHGLPRSADGFLHIIRTALLDYHLHQGVFYPRWIPELVKGYGYPVMNFYGPTTYYLAELFRLAGLGPYTSLMGTFMTMVILAGAGMRLLAADLLSAPPQQVQPAGNSPLQPAPPEAIRWASLAAAAAYLYAPYLLTNVFVRAAIGEVGAQALLPWIFWSFRRLLRAPQPARWLLPAVLSLGGLASTHTITLIFLPPVLLAYLALLWWTGERTWPRLAWTAAGGLMAMGVSAFFWLPLVGERQYLAARAYELSAQLFIPENVWTWSNFLNTALPFHYSVAIPFKLGLGQLALASLGFGLARRRDPEWLFLLLIVAATAAGISRAAMRIWLSSDILLIAQFPWRLLTIMSLPLALFTGGSLLHLTSPRWQTASAIGLMGLIILVNRPVFPATKYLARESADVTLPAVAQFEIETAGLGTSSAGEFMPRWVQSVNLDRDSAALPVIPNPNIRLESASAYEINLTFASDSPSQLRFTNFYYPAWQVTLDDRRDLKIYPTTNAGLLTIDLPAGEHRVRVRWAGTDFQRWGVFITLATLGVLTFFLSLQRHRWAILPLILLSAGLVSVFKPDPAPARIQPPSQPFTAGGIQLLGYRVERANPFLLYLFPYWYAPSNPPRWQAHWRLTDLRGKLVAETIARPYFNAVRSDHWPAGTVVDDAYQLSLPPDLGAGTYSLWLQLENLDGPEGAEVTSTLIEELTLDATPPLPLQPGSLSALDLRFGDQILLTGFDASLNERPLRGTAAYPVVQPGDLLEYTLYWRALSPITENFHGFIHLVDARQEALVKHDQTIGGWLRPTYLWDTFQIQPDTYRLLIPDTATNGLYWPQVGVYRFENLEHLSIQNADGQVVDDRATLLPVKIFRPQTTKPIPQYTVSAQFEEFATLLGYDLLLPPSGLHAGSTFTLTLYYRSDQVISQDYTQFVHIYAGEAGV
ncbi:MAG TPA: hypothetical protein VI688_02720, partial [Anaerolineales bacterium]|nr:hypothetical protein [Anaerolineales bacterium]